MHKFSTRAAHAARTPATASASRPLLSPIYQSTVYTFDRLEDLEALHDGAPGHIYYRNGTPTNNVLETAMAALGGAEAAVSAASGMALATATTLPLAQSSHRMSADR